MIFSEKSKGLKRNCLLDTNRIVKQQGPQDVAMLDDVTALLYQLRNAALRRGVEHVHVHNL